jgi:hypothetical protein
MGETRIPTKFWPRSVKGKSQSAETGVGRTNILETIYKGTWCEYVKIIHLLNVPMSTSILINYFATKKLLFQS